MRLLMVGAMLCAAGLLVSCATTGPEKSARAASSLRDVESLLQDADRQFGKLGNTLKDLRAAPVDDLRKAFDGFDGAATRTQGLAAKIRDEAEAMKKAGLSYFERWEKDAAALRDPELKALSTGRQNALRQDFKRVLAAMDSLDKAYGPFETSLRDLQAFLGNDLTRAGSELGQPYLQKAQAEAASVRSQLRETLATVRTIADQLEPK